MDLTGTDRRAAQARGPEREARLQGEVPVLEDDGIIFWDGTEHPPAIDNEDKADATTTIRISAENLEKLMAGGLDPTLAYMTGKLKVEGSMGVALKLTSMFAD